MGQDVNFNRQYEDLRVEFPILLFSLMVKETQVQKSSKWNFNSVNQRKVTLYFTISVAAQNLIS